MRGSSYTLSVYTPNSPGPIPILHIPTDTRPRGGRHKERLIKKADTGRVLEQAVNYTLVLSHVREDGMSRPIREQRFFVVDLAKGGKIRRRVMIM